MTQPPFRQDRAVQGWILVGAVSYAGDTVWTVALAWTAVHLASPAAAGLVIAAGAVPRAVVLLFGGALADRVDSRRLMLVTDAVRVVVLLSATVVTWVAGASVELLLVVAVLFGVVDAFYAPAAGTFPRQLVRSDELAAYSAGSQTAGRLGSMLGGAVGGVLVALWGVGGSALVDALTFLVLLGYLGLLLTPRYALPRAEPQPMLRGIAAAFHHLRDEPTTRVLVLTLMGLNLAVTPALSLGIALRASGNGWGAHLVGFSEALVGLGAVGGSLLMARWRPTRLAAWGFGLLIGQGLGIVALGVGGRAATCAVCAVIGLTAGAASVLLSAVFMAVVDPAYLGRMVAVQRLGDDVLMPATTAGFGALASATTVTTTFALYGAAMAAAMLAALARPAVRLLRLAADPAHRDAVTAR